MSERSKAAELGRDRLRCRIALNIVLDEQMIATLAVAASVLRAANDPAAHELDQAIRTHRIGILKQRAILGAAGIDV
jgi:hypothetical protein